MHIVVVGLSHRTAPVEVREKLSIPDQSITDSLKALKAFSDVLEVSILLWLSDKSVVAAGKFCLMSAALKPIRI